MQNYYDIVTADKLKIGDQVIEIHEMHDVVLAHDVAPNEDDDDDDEDTTIYQLTTRSEFLPESREGREFTVPDTKLFLRLRPPTPEECNHPQESISTQMVNDSKDIIITCSDCLIRWIANLVASS